MGSKSRIAKHIVPIIQKYIYDTGATQYVEPFCGGCNVIDKIECPDKLAADHNEYLIELLDALVRGFIHIPETLSREEYSRVRSNPGRYAKWYVGAVGFLGSYNGRFFDGGYAGTVRTKAATIRDYYDEARRNLLAQAEALKTCRFECRDYSEHNHAGAVIYCDPPYEGVKKYKDKFDHAAFWATMREWRKNNIVLVSGHSAPPDFRRIWEQPVTRTINNTKRVRAVERLFVAHGIAVEMERGRREKG